MIGQELVAEIEKRGSIDIIECLKFLKETFTIYSGFDIKDIEENRGNSKYMAPYRFILKSLINCSGLVDTKFNEETSELEVKLKNGK